jgi:uncharacterized damage-inducible protein DinB
MTVERIDPPLVAQEREMLDAWLDYHRATLAVKCEGLTDDQLRAQAVPPSSLSLLGLVRHMGEVERSWFRRVLGGEQAPPRYYSDENRDGDFDDVAAADVAAADVAEAFGYWRDECAHARERAAAAPSLDMIGTGRSGERYSLRWIMVHMIEEYARHNGHADLLRERIDGTVGD